MNLSKVKDETKYTYTSTPLACNETTYICQIFVPGSALLNAHPDTFTSTIKADLTTAFNGGGIQTYIRMSD